MELTSQEARVLGCLVEKQLTTPQQYPLTEKALITACNQTTSRDPVVSYDVSTVRITARSLREKGLVRLVHRTGERSDKHHQLLDSALGLSQGQVSVLAVLLLRGPQTLAELRTRCERMHPFDTLAQVQEVLEELADREYPLVARGERQPGHKEVRYGQLLVEPEQAQARPRSDAAAPPESHPDRSEGPSDRSEGQADRSEGPSDRSEGHADPPESLTLAGLSRQVELLRGEVAELRAQVDRHRGAPADSAHRADHPDHHDGADHHDHHDGADHHDRADHHDHPDHHGQR